uniref:ATP synthase complex subunit 8 n=1 Tax=Euplatypus parallelus TaxID=159894 RepID=A0A343C5F2_9CUCU|nr:ATP synthase F0 subunit 8 [Euplatypus parallelus]
MPQMAPYNWSLYLTLIIMFFMFLTVLTNYMFSNLSNTKSSKMKPKSLNWKW